MYIYNVTINIDEDVHEAWVKWMKDIHMPEVMKTGCFIDNQLLKVMYVEDNGHTYSAQYKFLEIPDIEKYMGTYAPDLQAKTKQMFGEKYTAFRTVLEIM